MLAAFFTNAVSLEVASCMTDFVNFHFDIDGDNFTSAGEASVKIKKLLRQMEFSAETIRRVSVAMYEGEINMVIHANGGTADVNVYCDRIEVILKDSGPGIPDIEKAMQEGFSTAPDNIRSLGFGAGMGLPNMKRNADDFHITSSAGEGTTIQMGFKL